MNNTPEWTDPENRAAKRVVDAIIATNDDPQKTLKDLADALAAKWEEEMNR